MPISKITSYPGKLFASILLLFLLAPTLLAQESEGDSTAKQAAADERAANDKEVVEDVIIVTASRHEQSLHEVPAAFTVLTSSDIENAPADDYGDLLRTVPGLNVTQISARDIQVSSRQATGSLATDQLVLLDGRSLYLDFFGFVMWDFLPVNTKEIQQIEVVRGPGSAVWGANALTGVINLITKRPRDIVGTNLIVGGGELDTAYASLTHAGADERLGYKLSLGYYEQEAYDRPSGVIPGTTTTYPEFKNLGTRQPKIDLRLDWDQNENAFWSFSGGHAGTDGIIYTGIGPFDIDLASMSFFKTSWTKGSLQANFFYNLLDGDAANLLTVGPDGQPLGLGFGTDTLSLDLTNTSVAGEKHIFTYGLSARQNDFSLSIAPDSDDRTEIGVFVQDEILLNDHLRWLIGARWDDMDPIGSVVSPRTSLMLSPNPNHTFRVSYNQAYRSPSVINNFLDTTIRNPVLIDPNLISGAIAPGVPCELVLTICTPFGFIFDTAAKGNPNLGEENLEAFEVGYVGTFGRNSVSVSVYHNITQDNVDFFNSEFYSSANPPAGWPIFLAAAPIPVVPPGTLPSGFTYRNVGETINEGVELGIKLNPSNDWSLNANYTYQAEPEVSGDGISVSDFNRPPKNRYNLGVAYDNGKLYAGGTLNHQDEAFWTDVLDSRFWGPTDAFTQVSVNFGARFQDDRFSFNIIGANIFDEDVQQHVFGDIIGRKISAELRFNF